MVGFCRRKLIRTGRVGPFARNGIDVVVASVFGPAAARIWLLSYPLNLRERLLLVMVLLLSIDERNAGQKKDGECKDISPLVSDMAPITQRPSQHDQSRF
jgi:hypothetical protein